MKAEQGNNNYIIAQKMTWLDAFPFMCEQAWLETLEKPYTQTQTHIYTYSSIVSTVPM